MSDLTCPVCLSDESDTCMIQLSCSHAICKACADKSAEAGLAACPLCRQPHLLDPSELREYAPL